MRKDFSFLFITILLPFLFLSTGCRENVDPEESEFSILTKHMEDNNLDLASILTGWVKPGSKIGIDSSDFSVPDYYILDFRSAEDFASGHIKGAHNVTFGTMLAEADNADKPILCVCYTGQNAARATGFLRLAGHNAASLKWGMSGWNSTFAGKWEANAGNKQSPNWGNTGTPKAIAEFASPAMSTGKTIGEAILTERINAAIALEWKVTNTAVLDNPNNYFVNNKWPQAAWDAYGHVDGAYRIDEDLLIGGLKNLDPSADLVTYCYTGQTSSITTAWLQVLGYENARSMLFGANGINHSALVIGTVGSAHKKSWKGEGSASNLGFGYYDANGDLHQ